jgi:hypothetical protein
MARSISGVRTKTSRHDGDEAEAVKKKKPKKMKTANRPVCRRSDSGQERTRIKKRLKAERNKYDKPRDLLERTANLVSRSPRTTGAVKWNRAQRDFGLNSS